MVQKWQLWRGSKPRDDGDSKLKRTITWYNKHGNLVKPIIFKNAKTFLGAIEPSRALKILKGLETKGPEIKDPNAWLARAAGRHADDLDPKVKKTISWYNKHGGLQKEIHFSTVKTPLSAISLGDALKILKGLEEKGPTLTDSTWWVVNAASKVMDRQGGYEAWSAPVWSPGRRKSFETDASVATGLDSKLTKTVMWYNKHGGLQQPIDLNAVSPHLSAVDSKVALQVLKGLDGKGSTVRNPTAWLCKAIEKVSSRLGP
uniref:Uncharacterized protein n=1 Tax=Karlodinium veneficum TaxID=407301 RepID=A7WPX5_KARVE|nr:unknown [Karlodinium veneficum]